MRVAVFFAIPTIAFAKLHQSDSQSARRLQDRQFGTSLVLDAKAGLGQEFIRKGDDAEALISAKRVTTASSSSELQPKPKITSSSSSSSISSSSTTTSTTSKGFFGRLKSSFGQVLFGLFVLIPFSIALLWVNEQRNARLESIISVGKSETITVDANETYVGKYSGQLVFLNSGLTQSLDPVADQRFPTVKMDSGCVRMMSVVEAYQWKEHRHQKTEKDNVGGGETTTTTFSYTMEWSAVRIDSNSFQQQAGHENKLQVPDLHLGSQQVNSKTVKYGECYYIPEALTLQLNNWQSATDMVGESVECLGNKFQMSGKYYYFPPLQGSPVPGGMRVNFSYILDGPATVLALQAEDRQHQGSASFLPYRLVNRGCCGNIDDETLRERLLIEGEKTPEDLYNDSTNSCLCFTICCNLVQCCFAHFAPPQVFGLWSGKVTKAGCFSDMQLAGMLMKWAFRILGWLLLYFGVYSLFSPIFVTFDIIPFLGKYISGGAKFVVGMACFIVTLVLATLVAGLAWLRFHPIVGATFLTIAGAAVVSIVIVTHH